ncbi:MAG: 50S ribosomal protein L19 [bacterium]|nr:50S ribosomal protein L19 [bacterium]
MTTPPATAAPATLELKPGMTVRVHQKIKEISGDKIKERVQIFEGIILAYQRSRKPSPTIIVRKISAGVGVEKIFPIGAPTIVKIEPVKQAEVRRAKLYYLRNYGKKLREKKIV